MGASKEKLRKVLRLPRSVLVFIKQSKDELKKVTWPDRRTTFRYTAIVVAVSLGVGLVTGGIDYVLKLALEKIIIE